MQIYEQYRTPLTSSTVRGTHKIFSGTGAGFAIWPDAPDFAITHTTSRDCQTFAVLFSYAIVVFLDTIVFGLTFFGGILFAVTWLRNKSLCLVSLEHGAYGLWLFTLGAGQTLGFKYYY